MTLNVAGAGSTTVRSSGWLRISGGSGGGTVTVESGISDRAVAELRKRGHQVERGASVGGYQGILIDWKQNVLHGGTESRKDGAAVGW